MTEEFLKACYEEQNEIATEIEMLGTGELGSDSEQARILRIRKLRRLLTRLDAFVEELEAFLNL